MTTYADIDHDEGDLSEYTSTTGDVRYQAIGGWNQTGSIFANGDSAAAFGTVDLGVIANTAYFRARINPAAGLAGTVLRGRETGGNPAWEFDLTDAGDNEIGATIKMYKNSGTETFTLTFPYAIVGAFWIQLKITVGAAQGAVQAWINDAEALAEQTFGPNDNKLTEDLDVGIIASTANPRVNIDEIGAQDASIAAPGWTPVLQKTWTEQTRTKEIWGVTGEPTGDWQAYTDKTTGFTTLSVDAIRGVLDIVEFQDPSGGTVYSAPADYGEAPATDTQGRAKAPQIAPLIRFRRIDQIAAVRAGVEFLT